MKNILLIFALVFTAGSGAVFSQDAPSEEEMFSGAELPTQAASSAPAAEEEKSLAFSGEAVSVLEDVVYSTGMAGRLNSYFLGNIFLDARLKNGVKAFANVETSYYTSTRETESGLREAFIDFNLDRRAYFRTGKQVLQWGRCYLWNPTDLVNVEKKPFVRKIGYREGAYGLKVHIPFGTKYNIYGFLDTGSASEDRDLSGALKFEFLAGGTEMAFSGWAKRSRRPVFGYDLSTSLGAVDIAAEASVARRDNTRFMREEGGALYSYLKDDGWVTKAAVNFSRGFRLGNFNDRLTASTEFFYNKNGYTSNPFKDRANYLYTGPLAPLLTAGTKQNFLLYNGLYEPNYLSRYYGATFLTVTRFIVTDMTLNLNYIRNLCDGSGVLSAGVYYKTLNDFSAGLLVNSFLGPRYGEYTFSGAKLAAQLTFGVSF
ncbi:MAG: hypothetical protein A3J79_13550 [Elusimicrobia bacterium RIFOXYB2_FULL_62_6]|nr:MAG: hypothetical protein A3J79_13550 [Elusimicrobia bacterium RIFOXYB2_FULL_62_6]